MIISDPTLRPQVEKIFARFAESIDAHLGIEYHELSRDRVVASMPVDSRTCQPFGVLHGGASVVLAESVASVGGCLNLNLEKQLAMGMEINANHVKSVRAGRIRATATPLHRGATSQIWEIRITQDPNGNLVCISRCTLAVRPR